MENSRVLLTLAAGILSASVSFAQSEYPPAYPREGVEMAFQNERVIVWKGVAGIKSRPTAMHKHTLDLAGVFLDDGGPAKTIMPDGSTNEGTTPTHRGDVLLRPKGLIHIEEWLADGIRVIAIELKDDGIAGSMTSTALPRAFPRDGATLRRESNRVAMWEEAVEGSPKAIIVELK